MWEFWLGPKAPVVNVKVDSDRGGYVLRNPVSQGVVSGLRYANRLQLTPHLPLVLGVVVKNGAENFAQLLRRDIGPAGYDPAFSVQEGGCGPAPHVVPPVYIGPLVSVDPYRDEVLVYHIDYRRI